MREIRFDALVGAGALALFCATACPTVFFGDGAELVVAADGLGVAHPPGYPWWTLLVKASLLVPAGEPAWRAKFRSAQEALFEEALLTPEERTLVRDLDWRGMIHYGVSFFMLEKLGASVGVSNLHIYAAMRGQTLAEFQQTRNAPGALYSVAGTDAAPAQQSWMQNPVTP